MRNKAELREIEINFLAEETSQQLYYIDRFRMMQVLINLLSNAIKFSKPRTQIYIEAIEVPSKCALTHQQVEINVVDQGIGMTEEHMKPLFKPYYTVQTSESRAMNPYGAGLGL